MKILIIGGSGHVSGSIAELALYRNHEVWALTRGNRPLDRRIKALTADRQIQGAMEAAVTAENMMWDLVVDCICFEKSHMLQNIALFPGRAKHFVFISSDFVYHPAKRLFPQPVDGEYCTEEINSYGWKKKRCEEELVNGDTGSMSWTVLRPCHIFGPRSELGCFPLHGRDPDLIRKLREGEKIRLAGGGHFLQQPLLAKDLAETVLSIAGKSHGDRKIFNMAGPDIIESRQYYQIIANILKVDLSLENIPLEEYRKANPQHSSFLCHRIYDLSPLRESGLSVPSTTIEEGLRMHVEGLMTSKGSI